MMVMSSGTIFGDFLSRCFQKSGAAVRPNALEGEARIRIKRITDKGYEYAVTGRIDQLARDSNDQIIGYEFKTKYSDFGANMVLGDWRGSFVPETKHVLQTALYAWWGRSVGILDWRLTYFYINMSRRDKNFYRTYSVSVDKDGQIFVDNQKQAFNIHHVFEKYDILANALVLNEAPEKEGRLFIPDDEVEQRAINNRLTKKDKSILEQKLPLPDRDSPCTYCSFKDQCWSAKEIEDHAAALSVK
jgi:hypothetical protein